jgi:hypothetical protein
MHSVTISNAIINTDTIQLVGPVEIATHFSWQFESSIPDMYIFLTDPDPYA